MISIGVDKNRHRKVLGVNIAFEESYPSYLPHFSRIKDRGLKYVDLTISDDHKGIIETQQGVFPNTPHQRCICHFMRNVLSHVPYKGKAKLTDYLKQFFNSPNRQMATTIAKIIAQNYQQSYTKVSQMLQEELEIDEQWQTGRRYMKIIKENRFSQEDDPLLEEIKQINEGVNTKEELVAT